MKRATTLLAAVLWTGAMGIAALAEGAPKIQFDQTVYDFGKTSQVASVSGVFKFKNTGDGLLKVEPPKPSCGCTVAGLKPDTLPPGETGELPFTLSLGQVKAQFEKHIAVKSNDPQTPEVSLTIKVDYTPLYDINPMTLVPRLAFGMNDADQFTTIIHHAALPSLAFCAVTSSHPSPRRCVGWTTQTKRTRFPLPVASASTSSCPTRRSMPALDVGKSSASMSVRRGIPEPTRRGIIASAAAADSGMPPTARNVPAATWPSPVPRIPPLS
ncbi:MAG: DUF1573 domain-containing protein [Verrucomicrobiia bacterium]|jgi:hypothetical protein